MFSGPGQSAAILVSRSFLQKVLESVHRNNKKYQVYILVSSGVFLWLLPDDLRLSAHLLLPSDKQVGSDWCSSWARFECAHRAFTFLVFVISSFFVSKLSNLTIATNYRIYNVGPVVADKKSTFVQKVYVKTPSSHDPRPPPCQLVSSKWSPPSLSNQRSLSTGFGHGHLKKRKTVSFPEKMRVVVVSFSVLFYDKSASSSIEYHGDEGREDGFSSQKYTIMN